MNYSTLVADVTLNEFSKPEYYKKEEISGSIQTGFRGTMDIRACILLEITVVGLFSLQFYRSFS
jgi:hypothetical protein